tara:strand:+ start:138 stop:344 length:207 start_codon:yes stop_codon:yes gene_type:complete
MRWHMDPQEGVVLSGRGPLGEHVSLWTSVSRGWSVDIYAKGERKTLKYPPNYSRNLVMKCIEMFLYQK